MSTDLVDVGSAANDGTGDTVRAAFQAVNTMLQAADATTGGKVIVFEDTDGGTNTVTLTPGTTSITSNRTVSLPNADVDLAKVNYLTAAAGTTGAYLSLLERTDGGTDALILTVGNTAIGASRTITGPTGGNVDLESVRLLDAQYTDAAATTGGSLKLLERTDGGTDGLIITVGNVAIGADRTLTGPTGGDLALESTRLLTTHWTEASASGAASLDFHEDTDNGSNRARLIGPASTADVTITLPAADTDLAKVNYLTAAGAATGATLTLAERTDGGTDALILTVGDVAIGASRTITGPTGGNLALETVRTAIIGADASAGAALRLYEDTDGGTNYVAITPGTTALASNRTVSCPDADVNLAKVNYLTAPASGVPGALTLAEDTDNGTSSFILTAPSSLAANRTVTGPTGGDLDLESVRLLDAAWTDAEATTGASIKLLERTDGGTDGLIITVGNTAIGADRTVTGPTGGDLDLESVRLLDAAWTDATAGTGANLKFLEETGSGTNTCTLTMGAGVLSGNISVTLPTAALGFDALMADNTDGQSAIPVLAGTGDAGTWTKAVSSGGLQTVTRTASADAQSYWVPVPIPNRTTALKGIKPTGLRVKYTVATADVDDVRAELWKVTQGADGAALTAAVLFGEDNADYEESHNSAAERGDDTAAPELHLAVVTDAGTPAFVGTGEELLLRFYVDGEVGGAGVVALQSAILCYTEQLLDYA